MIFTAALAISRADYLRVQKQLRLIVVFIAGLCSRLGVTRVDLGAVNAITKCSLTKIATNIYISDKTIPTPSESLLFGCAFISLIA